MGDDTSLVYIVIFAMAAAFLWLRLKSVLGRRMGDEPPPGMARSREAHADGQNEQADQVLARTPAEHFEIEVAGLPVSARQGLRDIHKIERNFSISGFLEGAKSAHVMILEAFWSGDTDDVASFLGPDVAQQFSSAVEARKAKGHVVENQLLETTKVEVTEARLEGDNAEITVKFVSDIVAVTRDENGTLLEGDTTDTIEVTDVWTFARKVPSADPNWVLIATRAG